MATHFAVLPQGIIETLSHEFLSLPHPRTGYFSLFVPTDTQILEVQAVSPSSSRSWFVEQQVVQDGKLLVMTPVDAAFLLIGLLQSVKSSVFRTADDIFEQVSQNIKGPGNQQPLGTDSAQAKSVNRLASLKCIHHALRRVCERKDNSADTVVYRYSDEKAMQYLRRKVDRLSRSKDLDQSKAIVRILARDGLMDDGKETLLEQGRTKATCDIIAQYLSPTMKQELLSSYNLVALDKYLKENISVEPLTSSTNTVGKSAAKGDNDKKRKATKASHRVEQLKKVNTAGMSKLSSFFTKVEKAK